MPHNFLMNHSKGLTKENDPYLTHIIVYIYKCKKCFSNGSVSGSGTGPGDPGSRGPAMPDPETFPYEWLGVRQ